MALLCALSGCPSSESERAAGTSAEAELVRVRSPVALGVPLHPRQGSSEVSGRIENGASVRVLRRAAAGGWLEVEGSNGARGWIVRRYVEAASSTSAPAVADSAPPREERVSVWSSRAACLSIVASGKRAMKRADRFRVGSWNVRWFPDGGPRRGEQPTDVKWLACAIVWLGVDVLAVQEFKQGADSAAGRQLIGALTELSGHGWRLVLDDCPADGRQHVGLLYDTEAALVTQLESDGGLNPRGSTCGGRLRPGLLARVAKRGGGVDFGVLVVHLKSGVEDADYRARSAAWQPLGRLVAERARVLQDADQLVLGDWNSMGCARCGPAISGSSERGELGQALARHRLSLLSAACTQYYSGEPGALDHAAVSEGFVEARGATLQVGATCAERRCRAARSKSPTQASLSDHCPVWLDLESRDLD